jgi:PAS domain S-box-containing protein
VTSNARDPEGAAPLGADLSQRALDSLPGLFYLLTTDGKFLRWNAALEKVSGYDGAEIARMHPVQFFSAEERPLIAASIEHGFVHGEVTVEACLLARDGTKTPFFFSGKTFDFEGTKCLIGMGIDVTQRRMAIEALRRSEDRLRAIIEQSPISMAIVAMDGTIEYINRRAVETFGYAHEDIPDMDRWWAQAYPDPEYRAQVIARWMKLLEVAITRGREIERREYEVTCKDGSVKTMVIFGVVVADKVFVMFEDVTARKEAEQARLREEARQQRAQRMEALGTLSGGIAHDFNNILVGVMGNADLLLRRIPIGDAARSLVSDILEASFRARDLVKQILAFARREGPERRPEQLAQVVGEALRLLQATLPPNVAVEFRAGADVPMVSADRSQVHQVVTNLATNAAHAIGTAHGKVVVTVDAVEITAAMCSVRHELRPGRFARLTVSDTGRGMTAETVARAFEPFFTTKPVGEGTGLGLSIVHGIMARHDGHIVLHSTPATGSTFELYFPAETAGHDAAELPSAPSPTRTRRLRVLLVDDEALVVRATTGMLEQHGWEVVGVLDPADALVSLSEGSTKFDVAIVDLAMPRMSGEELARRIRALGLALPILLASGTADRLDAGRLRAAGIDGALAKPFDGEELFEAVERVLRDHGASSGRERQSAAGASEEPPR